MHRVSRVLPLYTLLMNRGPSPDTDGFPPSRLRPSPAEVFSTSTHRASCAATLLPAVKMKTTGALTTSRPVPPNVLPWRTRAPSTLTCWQQLRPALGLVSQFGAPLLAVFLPFLHPLPSSALSTRGECLYAHAGSPNTLPLWSSPHTVGADWGSHVGNECALQEPEQRLVPSQYLGWLPEEPWCDSARHTVSEPLFEALLG